MTSADKSPISLIFLLWCAGLLAAGQFAKISIPFDQIREAYPDQGAALGFVVSLISVIGVLFGLVAGMFIARNGYKQNLIMALLAGAVMSFVQATMPSFGLFLATRLIEGASHLIIVVAAPSMLAQIAAPKDRNLVMTLWSTFFAVSFVLFSWGLLPLVGGGIEALLGLHGALMALVALLTFRMLPKDNLPKAVPISLGDIITNHVAVYRSPRLAAAAFGWFFYAASFVALVTVLPDFMPDYSRGFLGGVLPLAALFVSMTLGVWMLSKLPAMQVLLAGFVVCALGLAAFALGLPSLASITVMLGAMGLVQAGSFSLVPQLNHEAADQALANGAMAQMGNAGNVIGTPILLALVAMFGQGGMIGFGLFCFAGGVATHLWCAARR